LSSWHDWAKDLRQLDGLPWPSGFDPSGIRGRVDAYLQGWAKRYEGWATIERLCGRVVQLVEVVVGWLALRWVADRTLSGLAALGVATVAVLIAYGTFRLLYLRLVPANTRRAFLAKGILVSLCLTLVAASIAAAGHGRGWPAILAATLAMPVAMAIGYALTIGPVRATGLFRIGWPRRSWPRERILDHLLDILGGMAIPGQRNDLRSRGQWMWLLEQAAVTMRRRLPAVLPAYDRATAAHAAERARGAAEALRQLKYRIMAPDNRTWDRVEAVLIQDVIALTTGNLRQLAWARPPTRAQVRRSRWMVAWDVLRSILFAAVPLVLVLATRPVVHLDAGVFAWAKVVSIAWAALYLLATMDPTLRDKLDTARSLLSTVRDVGRPPQNG